jgi:hypothetical protein
MDREDRLSEMGCVACLRGGQSNDGRHVLGNERSQRTGWDIRPEIEHVEAGALQHIGNHPQSQHVRLPLHGGEHDTLTRARRCGLQRLLER